MEKKKFIAPGKKVYVCLSRLLETESHLLNIGGYRLEQGVRNTVNLIDNSKGKIACRNLEVCDIIAITQQNAVVLKPAFRQAPTFTLSSETAEIVLLPVTYNTGGNYDEEPVSMEEATVHVDNDEDEWE